MADEERDRTEKLPEVEKRQHSSQSKSIRESVTASTVLVLYLFFLVFFCLCQTNLEWACCCGEGAAECWC